MLSIYFKMIAWRLGDLAGGFTLQPAQNQLTFSLELSAKSACSASWRQSCLWAGLLATKFSSGQPPGAHIGFWTDLLERQNGLWTAPWRQSCLWTGLLTFKLAGGQTSKIEGTTNPVKYLGET